MLLEFSIKNFLSLKDETTFSMEAATGNENEENIIINNNERILKTTALYGANASGKTNLIKAFAAMIKMVRLSNNRQIGEKLVQMEPFVFDEESKNKPCEFEIVFIANGSKYIYGFTADKDKVYEEYLYKYFSAKPTRIFERTNCNDYKFLQSDEGKLNAIKEKNTDNKLFLATATTWNYDGTKDAYLWFAKYIDTFEGGKFLTDFAIDSFNKNENEELKKFTLKLLEEADIVIKDYSFEIEERDNDLFVLFKNLNMPVPSNSQKQKNIRIKMVHEVKDENNNTKTYDLNFINESSGTQILFSLAPILKDVFENGKVMIVDEMERSLHPNLVEMIIKFFHNSEINKGNAQLIFSTHDVNLLSLEIFRRDQIWFAEKNPEKGATELYPLDDFPVRKTENIQKGYLNGRYGAIPLVATGNNIWEE